MSDIGMAWVTMDEEGRITLPPAMRRQCGFSPGESVLILRSAASGSLFLNGVGLMLFSPVSLGRKLSRTQEALEAFENGQSDAA